MIAREDDLNRGGLAGPRAGDRRIVDRDRVRRGHREPIALRLVARRALQTSGVAAHALKGAGQRCGVGRRLEVALIAVPHAGLDTEAGKACDDRDGNGCRREQGAAAIGGELTESSECRDHALIVSGGR